MDHAALQTPDYRSAWKSMVRPSSLCVVGGCWRLTCILTFTLLLVTVTFAADYRVYIGTYNGPRSQGIYTALFDSRTGKLTTPELAAETRNPSFLALHPNGQRLYAIGEISGTAGKPGGAVSAFKLEDPATGKLSLLNQQSSGGAGPCHLALDQTSRCLMVANYGGGSIAAFPVQPDGQIGPAATFIQHEGHGPNAARQAGPHAHQIVPDPQNRRALVCDLGLDKVLVYKLDPERATLATNQPPFGSVAPGAGPRHLAFHPDGQTVFVLNEINSTLTALHYEASHGALTELQTVPTLPGDYQGKNTCAEVAVHPSGRFVYASNRGHDSIAVWAFDGRQHRLRLEQHEPTQGKAPRHFAIDPTGRWLIAENQSSDSIVVFAIDPSHGRLTANGQTQQVGSPVCLVFLPLKKSSE